MKTGLGIEMDIFSLIANFVQMVLQTIANLAKIRIKVKIQSLHLFSDDDDTYVAFDADDAEQCYFEHVGEKRINNFGVLNFEKISDWTRARINFEKKEDFYPLFSKLINKPDGVVVVDAWAWAWVLYNGRGFICSTEY
jgi:hypothetical protein